MTTAYTSILKLALPVQGELDGSWGDVVNDNITEMVEEAIAGRATINSWATNSHTLTEADGTTSESRAAMLNLTDTGVALSGAGTLICPTATKIYIVENGTGQQITVKTSAGSGVAIPDGATMFVFCDGTDVVQAVTNIASLTVDGNALTISNAFTTSGGHAVTLTTTGTTDVTLPATGTLATVAQVTTASGQVQVSSNDTTPGDIETKLLVGTGLSLATQNEGGNETRTVSLDDTLIEVDSTGLGIGDFSASNPSNALHIKKAFPAIKLEDTDSGNSAIYARVVGETTGGLVLASDPNNLGGSSHIRMEVDGQRVARANTTGLLVGDKAQTSLASNTLHVADSSPIVRLESTAAAGGEYARIYTDTNGRLYLDADPTNVNGSSEVRVMDNSLIVARFRSGVGMDLFDDNHRVVIGGDRVQSEIDSYTLNFPTDQTITTTTSSAFHSGALFHTLQRGDGTSHLEVTMNIGWRTIANSSGHGRAVIEPYYYTGTAYTPIRTALDSAESQQVVGVFSGNANQQNSGRVTIKMILDSSFIRSDVANMITIKMGGQCADTGMSWVTEGVSYYVREVLI